MWVARKFWSAARKSHWWLNLVVKLKDFALQAISNIATISL
jgi:hypothetical protein